MSPIVRFERALITLYQALRYGKPSPCRFVPSCSAYAAEALETTSFFRANRLIAARLLRCRPGGGWGADPVPHAHAEPPSVNSAHPLPH